jgi:hypothetical protein
MINLSSQGYQSLGCGTDNSLIAPFPGRLSPLLPVSVESKLAHTHIAQSRNFADHTPNGLVGLADGRTRLDSSLSLGFQHHTTRMRPFEQHWVRIFFC